MPLPDCGQANRQHGNSVRLIIRISKNNHQQSEKAGLQKECIRVATSMRIELTRAGPKTFQSLKKNSGKGVADAGFETRTPSRITKKKVKK
jgi:hypothetical protein